MKLTFEMNRGEYSLVNMAGEPQRVVELFPTGKSQEPRVTLLQVFTSAQSDIAKHIHTFAKHIHPFAKQKYAFAKDMYT